MFQSPPGLLQWLPAYYYCYLSNSFRFWLIHCMKLEKALVKRYCELFLNCLYVNICVGIRVCQGVRAQVYMNMYVSVDRGQR